MAYPERQLEKIIKQFCKQTDTKCTVGADGWMFTLQKNGKKSFVIGYKFDLNNATSCMLCDDKSALSEILKNSDIPCVEHRFIEAPNGYNKTEEQNLKELEAMLNQHGELVLKPNIGSGGRSVVRVNDMDTIKLYLSKHLSAKRPVGVCKFEHIKNEYRIVCLDGKPRLVYRKQRPFVVGDGKNTIEMLVHKTIKGKTDVDSKLDLNRIPEAGEVVYVSWKHNLGLGASADVKIEKSLKSKLMSLAKRVVKEINICFASVDIIELEDDSLKVLEVNSGVMMEKFSSASFENFKISRQIYFDALAKSLKIKLD